VEIMKCSFVFSAGVFVLIVDGLTGSGVELGFGNVEGGVGVGFDVICDKVLSITT